MILGCRAEYYRIDQTCYLHDVQDFDASLMQHHDLPAPLLKLIKGFLLRFFPLALCLERIVEVHTLLSGIHSARDKFLHRLNICADHCRGQTSEQ